MVRDYPESTQSIYGRNEVKNAFSFIMLPTLLQTVIQVSKPFKVWSLWCTSSRVTGTRMPGSLRDLPHPKWGITHFVGPLSEKQELGMEADYNLLICKVKFDVDLFLQPLKTGTKLA